MRGLRDVGAEIKGGCVVCEGGGKESWTTVGTSEGESQARVGSCSKVV